jgi:ABC-type siderophore export system fused ATPase/permease subunit
MSVVAFLYFVGAMFALCMAVVLLILWRVERFMHRVLAYIKADTVFGAENALKPKETEAPAETEESRLRRLQEEAYAS